MTPRLGGSSPGRSQWSLTFEVRKSCAALQVAVNRRVSQWSLTFEVRKRPGYQGLPEGKDLVAMEPDL